MAKKTLYELAEEAQILADDLAGVAGAVSPDPIPDIFKPNEKVTAVQLRQMAYKLKMQATQLAEMAKFMEDHAKAVEGQRPVIWRIYASLYLDNAEDQMRIGLDHCLGKMKEDALKLTGSESNSVAAPVYEYPTDRSMATELESIRKEVGEMMD